MFDKTIELEPITVHTGERVLIQFAEETNGISMPITISPGIKGIYVAPLEELPWLSRTTGENGRPVTSEEESITLSK